MAVIKRVRNATFALAGLMLLSGNAAAQPVGDEGARQLLEALQTYLGKPAPGEQGVVSVEPAGSAYRIRLDIERLAAPLLQFGLKMTGSESSFSAAPQPDGTWRVSDFPASMGVDLEMLGQFSAYRVTGLRAEGVFDPNLRIFVGVDQTVELTTSDSEGPGTRSTMRRADERTTLRAVPVGNGAADVQVRQTFGVIESDEEFTLPSEPGAAVPPVVRITSRLQSASAEGRMQALQSRQLADVLAFLLAHPSRERLAAEQDQLKTLLSALLPIFQSWDHSLAGEGVSVDTSIGRFSADRIGGTWGLSGIGPEGRFATTLNVTGFAIPPEMAPAWASGLVPTELEIGVSVTSYKPDVAVRQLIHDLDLRSEVAIPPDRVQSALALGVPPGGIDIAFGPIRSVSPVLKVDLSGRLNLKGPSTSGTASVRAVGLADAIKALQQAGAGDGFASQALTMLMAAQVLGKSGPDNSMTWDIEAPGDGGLLVNGQQVRAPQ